MQLFLFIAMTATFAGGFYFLKLKAQAKVDFDRQYYRIVFPSELTAQEVGEWLLSISGALRTDPMSSLLHAFKGDIDAALARPSICFEVHATESGLTHSMRVPWQQAEFILAQLRAKIPGIYAERLPTPVQPRWMKAVEYGESNPQHTLNITDPTAVAERILNSMNSLREEEQVLMQWVVTSIPLRHLPTEADNQDILGDQRNQLNQLNLGAVLRVAAISTTTGRASNRVKQVATALASVRTAHNSFRRRLVGRNDLDKRIRNGSGALTTTASLKVNELAGLIGWANNSSIAGLPRGRSRMLTAPSSVPEKGIIIGKNPSPGRERPVAISYSAALVHTWIGGRTGVGKSALLANMAAQIMHADYGLILMESEGDLYESVLNYVPSHRLDDVILLDFADPNHMAGFNPLDQGKPDVAIDQLIKLLEHKYGGSMWADELISNSLRSLKDSPDPVAITDLLPLISPRTPGEVAWAEALVSQISDPELKYYWESHGARGKEQRQQRADPVLSRMNQFVMRPELRHVFGQRQSTFKIADVLNENKILLVNLKGVSSQTSSLVGTLLMDAVWTEAKEGATKKPNYLMLDEFADYMDLPVGFETMLAQARKRNLGLILANQHLSQLSQSVREGVLSNARNKIAFQSKDEDAKTLLREMGSNLNPSDITNLQLYEAMADVVTATGTSGPFTVRTNAPFRPENLATRARAISRQKYTRPLHEVRDELLHRYDQPEKPRPPKRPRLTGDEF